MNPRHHGGRAAAIALLAAAAAALPAAAQPVDDGRLLASGCFQCHGTGGARGGFDTLAGKSRQDLLEELNEMRKKSARSNIMVPHAHGYTAQQLSLIADYFARQPKP